MSRRTVFAGGLVFGLGVFGFGTVAVVQACDLGNNGDEYEVPVPPPIDGLGGGTFTFFLPDDPGPEYRWQPASGCTTLIDNRGNPGVPSECLIEGIMTGTVMVRLELDMSDWGLAAGAPSLGTHQATIDGNTGFYSGDGDNLFPTGGCCPGDPQHVFIDLSHPRHVFRNMPFPPCSPLPALNISTLNYELGASILGGCSIVDPGTIEYGGTIDIDVPVGAAGVHTFPFITPETKTFMNDADGAKINPLAKTPVLITVPVGQCCYNIGSGATDCADGISETSCAELPGPRSFTVGATCAQCCDHSSCRLGGECRIGRCGEQWDGNAWVPGVEGVCGYQFMYDPETECCDPETGLKIPIEDGNECTNDYCNEDTGHVTHIDATGPACEHISPCVINDDCAEGLCIGDLPEDVSIPCAGDEDCPEGWFCDTEVDLCDCVGPHDVRKNRYISFGPESGATPLAYEVTMTASTYFPGSTGVLGWVGEPFDASCQDDQGNPQPGYPACRGVMASRLVDEPYFSDLWPVLLDVGDCPIVPVAEYEIRGTPDGFTFGDPIEVGTILKPDKYWADVVGVQVEGEWTAPEGVVNFDDIQASILKFEHKEDPPYMTWIDIAVETPDVTINMSDIQMVVLAFEHNEYLYPDPIDCP